MGILPVYTWKLSKNTWIYWISVFKIKLISTKKYGTNIPIYLRFQVLKVSETLFLNPANYYTLRLYYTRGILNFLSHMYLKIGKYTWKCTWNFDLKISGHTEKGEGVGVQEIILVDIRRTLFCTPLLLVSVT